MIQKPYEMALLVVPTGGQQGLGDEIKNLLADDWNDLVAAKGTNRLKMTESSAAATQSFYFGPSPVYVYFFDSTDMPKKVSSLPALEKEAQETILLTGWKREDIRDMLQSLLP